jgi:DNA helicase-2/ATP-dependent DNA helicase PcrA
MNRLVIASAGSGKTNLIVKNAIDDAKAGRRVLITTFTEACEHEIRSKVIQLNGCVPAKVDIITWFSFLIRHGVKPFQGCLFDFDTKGMLLVNGRSGLKFQGKMFPVYWGEENFEKFYFTEDKRIYSDKLAQLVIRLQVASRCYEKIYIDEVQDLAGYDLEVLDLLFKIDSDVLLVGDPRQATYATNNSRKNKKYVKSAIVNFFLDERLDINIDDTSLQVNHRCAPTICDYSNKLFPNMSPATSGNRDITGHDGVFLVAKEKLGQYLESFQPVQLRDSIRTETDSNYKTMNFGKSKGLTLDRVLIYPSAPMVKWMCDNDAELTQAARSKFYVALTRAKNSVGIVVSKAEVKKISDLDVYE